MMRPVGPMLNKETEKIVNERHKTMTFHHRSADKSFPISVDLYISPIWIMYSQMLFQNSLIVCPDQQVGKHMFPLRIRPM